MDKLDQEILKLLVLNPRQSQPQLAKQLRTSREVLAYRINKLKREGLLMYYFNFLDVFKVGNFSWYYILIKHNLSQEEEEQLVHLLKENPIYNTGYPVLGGYDFSLSCIVRDKETIYDLIAAINDVFRQKISKCNIFELIEQHYFYGHFMGIDYIKNDHFVIKQTEQIMLDKIDIAVVKSLFTAPRKGMELANELDLSIDTVRKRTKKIYDGKILNSFAEINFRKLGYLSYEYVAIVRALDAGLRKKIISYAKMHNSFREVFFSIGEYNVLANLIVKDAEQLKIVLTEFKKIISDQLLDDKLLLVYPEEERYIGNPLKIIFPE